MTKIIVAALYKFTRFEEPAALQAPLLARLDNLGVKGTILLAQEGINGTIAGSRTGIDEALETIRTLPGCADIGHKESFAETAPFLRLKVRLKREIVTLGRPEADPTVDVGTYVPPEAWNALISDPDTIVIDSRNDYEVSIGSFKGAVDPKTTSFRELPDWLEANRAALENKKVAMFCTGGIRCEKSTAYVKAQGFSEVFHLRGGILKYLETIPETESLWEGECFVFDERISVKHGLTPGDYVMCHACRWPVDEVGRQSPNYVPGISCDHCVGTRDDDQRRRYAERQKQMDLAEERGGQHIGAHYPKASPKPL